MQNAFNDIKNYFSNRDYESANALILHIAKSHKVDLKSIEELRYNIEEFSKFNQKESIICAYSCLMELIRNQSANFDDYDVPFYPLDKEWYYSIERKLAGIIKDPLSWDDLISIEFEKNTDNHLEIISHCLKLSNLFIEKDEIDDADIQVMFIYTGIIASICVRRGKFDLLSNSAVVLIERLHQKDRGQKARDIAETISQFLIKNNRTPLSFFIHSCSYTYQGNTSLALMYALFAIANIKNDKEVSFRTISRLIKNIFLSLRNARMFNAFSSLFSDIKVCKLLDDSDMFSVEIAKAHCMLMEKNRELSIYVNDKFNTYREKFCSEGSIAVLPWLNILFQMQEAFPEFEAEYDEELRLFKNIIGAECFNKYKGFVFVNDNAEAYLERALPYLSEYVYEEDLSDNIRNSIVIACKSIVLATNLNSLGLYYLSLAYLLAPSIARNVTSGGMIYSKSPYKHGADIRKDFAKRMLKLVVDHKCNVVVLTVFNEVSNCLHIRNDGEEIERLGWNSKNYSDFLTIYSDKLIVNDEYGGLFNRFDKSWDTQNVTDIEKITHEFKLGHDESSKRLIILRSHFDSGYPHNLYRTVKGGYISELAEVCLSNTRILWRDSKAHVKFDWSIWAPRVAGDIAINMLASKIEDNFNESQIELTTDWSERPKWGSLSQISILVAHGSSSINKKFELHLGNGDSLQVGDLNIKSKVVFLFVCHSGKQGLNSFSYRIDSFIDKILNGETECVIAPCWPLHIDVANEYLTEFLKLAKIGMEVLNVHTQVLKHLQEKNVSPAVWANLHYFGNPTVEIEGS